MNMVLKLRSEQIYAYEYSAETQAKSELDSLLDNYMTQRNAVASANLHKFERSSAISSQNFSNNWNKGLFIHTALVDQRYLLALTEAFIKNLQAYSLGADCKFFSLTCWGVIRLRATKVFTNLCPFSVFIAGFGFWVIFLIK